ncbi:hypothetical protein [Paraburkholderia bannensis]|uniref:hypothetical protein n=1 Tax=Paraburkholderia bannensis TaxID=765414 RepID=UPI002AB6D07C|nr:hypothetical protein [Paraburkholderia bannensis]
MRNTTVYRALGISADGRHPVAVTGASSTCQKRCQPCIRPRCCKPERHAFGLRAAGLSGNPVAGSRLFSRASFVTSESAKREYEDEIHLQFSQYRIHGEWFEADVLTAKISVPEIVEGTESKQPGTVGAKMLYARKREIPALETERRDILAAVQPTLRLERK